MSTEVESIVQAIESLRQESNLTKDYLFPIVVGLISSFLGFVVAYFTLRYQENIQKQKERINAINDWMLLAEGAMSSLIAIKNNYFGQLNNSPIQRALVTRSLIHSTSKIDKNLSTITFLMPRTNDPDSQNTKWRQLPRIRAMVENYNFLLELWNKRSEIERPIKEKLVKEYGVLAHAEVTQEQIFETVAPSQFVVLIDLTERALKHTDDLIVELNDFLTGLPLIAETLISREYINRYGPVMKFSAVGNEMLLQRIEKIPEVDYGMLAQLFDQTEAEVISAYKTGYE